MKGAEQENQAGASQDGKPALGSCPGDIGIFRKLGYVEHLGRPRRRTADKREKLSLFSPTNLLFNSKLVEKACQLTCHK